MVASQPASGNAVGNTDDFLVALFNFFLKKNLERSEEKGAAMHFQRDMCI